MMNRYTAKAMKNNSMTTKVAVRLTIIWRYADEGSGVLGSISLSSFFAARRRRSER